MVERMGKRELVALLSLSFWCLMIVVWLFLAVPWVCLQFVIVVFSDHTHYFLNWISFSMKTAWSLIRIFIQFALCCQLKTLFFLVNHRAQHTVQQKWLTLFTWSSTEALEVIFLSILCCPLLSLDEVGGI